MPSATLIGDCATIAASRHAGASQFDYRPVTAQDVDGLAQAYLRAYPPGIAASNLDEARTEMLESFAGEFGTLLAGASLCAYHRDDLVGAILVVERSPWDPKLRCPFVIDLFVDPRWQGNGAGRVLLERSAGACLNEGHAQLALRVGEGTSPSASRIYASVGMVKIDPATL
ncbi:GNAT superfamily N-acetyltransferase [Arthrobacter pigmenti]|uniref:GNAT superfamily N-acetyltransferase n=1 Tax=Arthrobacter pigmenti TaxID=271432 RepID=A0A846RDP9_9MICC|nr:GNAT family N-acetyltransferase [Arthrobacter pigmenti]NJC21133.1 GNAT superfamily N-acetyltransferase [Arthrobacter pigmenti]